MPEKMAEDAGDALDVAMDTLTVEKDLAEAVKVRVYVFKAI